MEYHKVFYSHGVSCSLIIECPGQELTGSKKYPAVILCHGHSRHKNDGLDGLSHMLAQEGFLTIRFDFRGCGKEAARKYYLYCASEWPYDLIHVINYAMSLGCVDEQRIGVAGISMGACTAVYTAGMDKRIKAVVSMSGIGDCYEWMKHVWDWQGGDFSQFVRSVNEEASAAAATGTSQMKNVLEMYHFPAKDKADKILEGITDPDACEYIAWDSLQELLFYKPLEQCHNIEQPIFFLTGGADELVPHEQSERMYHAVSSKVKKIKDYPGVEHNIPVDPQSRAAFTDITEWFKNYL